MLLVGDFHSAVGYLDTVSVEYFVQWVGGVCQADQETFWQCWFPQLLRMVG